MNPAWVTALLALAGAVAAISTWVIRVGWKYGSKVVRFLDDFNGVPAHDGIPGRPGFAARLRQMETDVSAVLAETKPNLGTSLKDVLHQAASDVIDVKQSLARMDAQITGNTDSIMHLTARVEHFESERKARNDG